MLSFIAKARDFQVTLETEGLPLRDANGLVVDRTRGKRVVFHRGMFTANEAEARRLGYETESELVEALRAAASFNAEFYEVGKEPGRESPSLDEAMERVAVASAKQDINVLRDVLRVEEEKGYNRESVVNAAQRALGVLGDLEAGKRPAGRPRTKDAA